MVHSRDRRYGSRQSNGYHSHYGSRDYYLLHKQQEHGYRLRKRQSNRNGKDQRFAGGSDGYLERILCRNGRNGSRFVNRYGRRSTDRRNLAMVHSRDRRYGSRQSNGYHSHYGSRDYHLLHKQQEHGYRLRKRQSNRNGEDQRFAGGSDGYLERILCRNSCNGSRFVNRYGRRSADWRNLAMVHSRYRRYRRH
jgi:ribosomal protein S24E